MNLLEYEAKNILNRAGVAVPSSILIDKNYKDPDTSYPLVVKSQVPIGGRGKAGGIKVAKTKRDLDNIISSIFELDIKGHKSKSLLLEEFIDIKTELYLSLMINREKSQIDLVAHKDGGVEIESKNDFFRREITSNTTEVVADTLADYYQLPEKSFLLQDLIAKLFSVFVESDATLLEINPLILTKSGGFVIGDCKMTLDNAASFRHPEWNFEEKPISANFVVLDRKGEVATIANGAGLAMATVDAVSSAGLKPANFLDIGGSASVENIIDSLKKILEFPNIKAIIINIYGGIVRCDTVAEAIIKAKGVFGDLPNLQIRLSGTNSQEASEILNQNGLVLQNDLDSCIENIKDLSR